MNKMNREMSSPKRILVLGAGAWHEAYYRLINQMGLISVGMDRNPDAPSKHLANLFCAADPANIPSIIDVAQRYSVDAILPISEFGVVPASIASNQLGLRSHCNPEVALIAHNKGKMRQVWASNNIDQPRFFIADSLDCALDAAQKLGFPVVIKPNELSGARGVLRINGAEELIQRYASTAAMSDGTIVVEEFIEGIETSVEGIVVNGQSFVLAYADKELHPHSQHRVTQSINYPGAFTQQQVAGIAACAAQTTAALGLTNSPFHLEVFVVGNRVLPIEIGVRGGGGHIYSTIVELVSGVNLVQASIQLLLGETPVINPKTQPEGACYRFLFPPQGQLISISGIESAKELPGVADIVINVRPGDVLQEAEHGGARAGCIVTYGKDRHEAYNRADAAENLITWIVQ